MPGTSIFFTCAWTVAINRPTQRIPDTSLCMTASAEDVTPVRTKGWPSASPLCARKRDRLLFDSHRGGLLQPHGDRRARRQRRGVPAAGEHRSRASAAANGTADRRALGPAKDAAENRAADRAAADLGRTLVAGGIALTEDGLGAQRHARAISESDRGEATPEARAIAQFAATFDERHLAMGFRSGGNRHAIAYLHVARHAGHDFVFDTCRFARHRRLDLKTNHGARGDNELLVNRPARFH